MNKTLKFASLSQIEDALSNALSNGLWDGYTPFDSVDYDEGAYAKAKEDLMAKGVKEPDLESIQAHMVMMGGYLRFRDPDERKWCRITLQSWIIALQSYADEPLNGTIEDVLKGDPESKLDAFDYSNLIQFATFGEVIYG